MNFYEVSPKEIAYKIFSEDYKDPNTYQIIADNNINDIYYVFEVLLNVLVEGMDRLTGGLDTIDINKITLDHFRRLNPWFNSIGFELDVELYEDLDDYYCKIEFKNNSNETFFEYKDIKENFHFFLNANRNMDYKKLVDISAIYLSNNQNIKISFNGL